MEAEIQEKTKASIDQKQKDYYLREQMKAIREELGEGEDASEIDDYARKIRALKLEETHEKKLLKDVEKLRKYVTERGKILPKRITGTCSIHQRAVTTAVKRARIVALLPYVAD